MPNPHSNLAPLFTDTVDNSIQDFGPNYQLDVKLSNMEDLNSHAYLECVKGIVMEHLRHVGGPPGVQMTCTCAAWIPSENDIDRAHRYSHHANRCADGGHEPRRGHTGSGWAMPTMDAWLMGASEQGAFRFGRGWRGQTARPCVSSWFAEQQQQKFRWSQVWYERGHYNHTCHLDAWSSPRGHMTLPPLGLGTLDLNQGSLNSHGTPANSLSNHSPVQ